MNIPDIPDTLDEHAVIVRFRRAPGELSRIFDIELAIALALAKSGAGWYEGHELTADRSSGHLFMYGPDADALLAAIRPALERAPGLHDIVALLRYGASDTESQRTSIVIENKATAP